MRQLLILSTPAIRAKAISWIQSAPDRARIELKDPQRSTDQNSKMWAMLTDIAEQAEHCGRKYPTEAWKILFLHVCGRETQFLPALDGHGFIPWGQSSSDLSKAEMSDLIECMFAWGAEHGVEFHEPQIATVQTRAA